MTVSYKSADEKKTKPVQVYLSETEALLLANVSKELGISRSEIIRSLLMERYGSLTDFKSQSDAASYRQATAA